MPKITAYILTFNEEEKIAAAVETVLWADEVVVVDSFSTDRTPEIATALGARVVNVVFEGFGDLRNRALEAGFDEFWTKPIKLPEFLAGLDRWLAPRRARSRTPQ